MKLLRWTAALSALVVGAGLLTAVAADEKPTLKAIMKAGFKKDALIDKIKKSEASADEVKKFAEMCRAMCSLKPKKGDEASWKAKTDALAEAAEALAKGDEAARAKVVAASNCKACHSVHK